MKIYGCLLIILISSLYADKVKSLTKLKGVKQVQLIGYGIVTGLEGTGDSKKSEFTMQSIRAMFERFGVTVPKVQVKNDAAVMITANISPFQNPGTHIDVTVSSVGDAKSLQGGMLLVSPLADIHGKLYAIAQGPISVGGFSVETSGGGGVKKNYTLVGRVPNGGIIQHNYEVNFIEDDRITFYLNEPNFQTALDISKSINIKLGEDLAFVKDPGTIELELPTNMRDPKTLMPVINEINNLDITVITLPKIIVNERTGTIVIGSEVKIKDVAISHGNLSIEISANTNVSQPGAFSSGETVEVTQTSASINTEPARLLMIEKTTTVQDIAKSLNQLGVTPRDLIAIFQALKEAGALQAELIIM